MRILLNLRKYIPVALLFASACVTPYDAQIRESTPRIVIEGLITDQPGPHRVRITRTGAFTNDGSAGATPGIGGATVYATDDAGSRINFTESGAGNYFTASGVRGVVGRSYKLNIRLADGRTYVSEPDLLRRVPPIDSIYSEYDPAVKKFNVYVDITDSPVPGEGYLWKWTNYDFAQICELSKVVEGVPTLCRDCCTRCWDVSRCNNCVNVAGDQYVNGNQIRRQLITAAPYDSRGRYYLLIEQRSLSPGAFRFWNSLNAQSSSTGGPFDAAPAPVVGNLTNTADASEKVLGFFGASGVLLRQHWVNRNGVADFPNIGMPPACPAVTIPPPCVPCEEIAGRRTRITPPNWDN